MQVTSRTRVQIEQFRVWLAVHGATILPPAAWELIRWRPADGSGVLIVYTAKHGEVANFNCPDAESVWLDWENQE
jgi:hypothetical protein